MSIQFEYLGLLAAIPVIGAIIWLSKDEDKKTPVKWTGISEGFDPNARIEFDDISLSPELPDNTGKGHKRKTKKSKSKSKKNKK